MSSRIPPFVFLVPVAMLVIAFGNMPWGYYQVLRLIVAAASAWIAAVMLKKERQATGAAFAVLTLAYNPFLSLRLGRETWELVNVATVIAYVFGFGVSRKLSRTVTSQPYL